MKKSIKGTAGVLMRHAGTILSISAAIAASGLSGNVLAGGNIAAGKNAAMKYACASCHGANYNNPVDPAYPKLAGQHADYLEAALIAYKRGKGHGGRGNEIMAGQARVLSKEDIEDISAFLQSLPSGLVLKR